MSGDFKNESVFNILENKSLLENTEINYKFQPIMTTTALFPGSLCLLQESQLPLGLLIQPLCRQDESLLRLEANSIPRCTLITCRAYLCCYSTIPNKRHWQCAICKYCNNLSDNSLEQMNLLSEKSSEKQFNPSNSVEYILNSPKEQAPIRKSPVYGFLMDLSYFAMKELSTNTVTEIFRIISSTIEQLPGIKCGAKIFFIGYDRHIHLYQLNRVSGKFQELVLHSQTLLDDLPGDCVEIDCSKVLPCPIDELIVSIEDNKDQIHDLLDNQMFDNQISEYNELPIRSYDKSNCLGLALLIAQMLMQSCEFCIAKLNIFNATTPNIDPGALPNANCSLGPTSEFYKTLGLKFAQTSITVDLYELSCSKLDLASLGELVKYNGGHIILLEQSTGKCSVRQRLTGPLCYQAVLKVRYSTTMNVTVDCSLGQMFTLAPDLYHLTNLTQDTSIVVKLQLSSSTDTQYLMQDNVFIQSALLYSRITKDTQPEQLQTRYIRIYTARLGVTHQLIDLMRSARAEVICGLLMKLLVDRILHNCERNHDKAFSRREVKAGREALISSVVDPIKSYSRVLSGINSDHYSRSMFVNCLLLPRSLRMLPKYIWNCLCHTSVLHFSSSADTNVCSLINLLLAWRQASLSLLRTYFYPIMTQLSFKSLTTDPYNITEPLLQMQLSVHQISPDVITLLDTPSGIYIIIGCNIDPKHVVGTYLADYLMLKGDRSERGVLDWKVVEEANPPPHQTRLFGLLQSAIKQMSGSRVVSNQCRVLMLTGKLAADLISNHMVEDWSGDKAYSRFLESLRQRLLKK